MSGHMKLAVLVVFAVAVAVLPSFLGPPAQLAANGLVGETGGAAAGEERRRRVSQRRPAQRLASGALP